MFMFLSNINSLNLNSLEWSQAVALNQRNVTFLDKAIQPRSLVFIKYVVLLVLAILCIIPCVSF